MKKFLIGTTALVAAGVIAAPGAQAAEKIKLGVGGFMHHFVGYTSNDQDKTITTDSDGVDVQASNEIYFTGSTKLDNGITVSAVVQLESDQTSGASTNTDEVYVKLDSADLGSLFVGGTKHAMFMARHAAPNVTNLGVNAGHNMVANFTQYTGGAAISAITNTGGAADDAHKIVYFTPRFAGFRLGGSYTPDTASTTGASTTPDDNATNNVSDVTLDYSGKIGEVDLGVSGGYQIANGAGAALGSRIWNIGANAKVAGFTFGASYDDVSQGKTSGVATAVSTDGHMWDAGVSYATGPYSVSLTFAQSEAVGLINTTGDDQITRWLLGGKYNLGPGVDLNAAVMHSDYDNEGGAATTSDSDAWAIATGIALSF